ncbi:hypothetical protein GW17_00022689, partial [Ensete ventricosum]
DIAKIGRWRLISVVDGRLREKLTVEKSTVGGRLEKKKRKRRKKKRRRCTSRLTQATPIEALSVSAGPVEFSRQSQGASPQLATKSSTVGNPSNPKPYAGPNPEVHATAVACGARVISHKAAASLIKAIEARIRSSVAKSKLACGFRLLDSELTCPKPWTEEGKTKQNPMNIMSQGLEGSSEESKDDESAEAMELEVEADHPIAGADEQNQSPFEGQIGLLDPIGDADNMTVF